MRHWLGMLRLLADRRGITAVEYGLMCALIAAGIVTALTTLRGSIISVYTTIEAAL